MKVHIEIKGLEDLTKSYNRITDDLGKQLARAAIRSGLQVVAREIKKRLDPRIKHVKHTIGYRFKASPTRGITAAKVGFNVGAKKGTSISAIYARSGRNKGGVGISGNNVHWFIAGTKQRFRRQPGVSRKLKSIQDPSRRTGAMPAQQPGLAADAYRASAGAVKNKMQKAAQTRLNSIVKKLNRGK